MFAAQAVRGAVRAVRNHRLASAALLSAFVLSTSLALVLFGVVDAIWLRPLPYPRPEEVLFVASSSSEFVNASESVVSSLESRLADPRMFTATAAVEESGIFDPVSGAVRDWGLRPAYVSPEFFSLLGAKMAVGSAFTEADTRRSPRAAVISLDLWRQQFGGNRDILGRVVEIPGSLRGERWTIVGVMEKEFHLPRGTNFWAVASPQALGNRPRIPRYLRLAPGVSRDRVQGMLPELKFETLAEHLVPNEAQAVLALFLAATLCLLTTIIQVLGLTQARALARCHETFVKVALGATRSHLVTEAIVEMTVLAVPSMVLALLFAPVVARTVVSALPEGVARGLEIDLWTSGPIFLALLVVTALTSAAVLASGTVGRKSFLPFHSGGVRQRMLFGLQVAVSTALLYALALGGRSMLKVSSVDLGFRTDAVVAFRFPAPALQQGASREVNQLARAAHRDRTLETFEALRKNQVGSIATSFGRPLDPATFLPVRVVPAAEPATELDAIATSVSPGFVTTLGIAVLEGAVPEDDAPAGVLAGVAMVNQSLANRLARFGPVVGQQISLGAALKVVAIVSDARLIRPDEPAKPTLFTFYPSDVGPVLVVRLKQSEAVGVLTGAVSSSWGKESARRIISIPNEVARANAPYRALLILTLWMAAGALPIAVIGLVGAVRLHVARSERATAIRVIIGGSEDQVRRTLARPYYRVVAVAIPMGLLGGFGIGRLLASQLFGLDSVDIWSAVAAVAVITATVWPSIDLSVRHSTRVRLNSLWRSTQ